MVTRLCQLEALEIGVQIGLGVEGGAVDPRQLLVVLVAAPVRAGQGRELDRLDRLRILEVRAAAEIGEPSLRIERDLALGGVDELHLVGLVLLEEALLRLGRGDLLALPRAALLELAQDLGLDPLEVLLADRLRELEVVVEAVLDRRPDRNLHARVEPAHRLGEQVRGRVAQHRERVRVVGVPRRQDLDRLPVRERQAEVLDRPVLADQHRLLGELRADCARGVEPGRTVGKFQFARIGKNDLHERSGYSAPARGRPERRGRGNARARPRGRRRATRRTFPPRTSWGPREKGERCTSRFRRQ